MRFDQNLISKKRMILEYSNDLIYLIYCLLQKKALLSRTKQWIRPKRLNHEREISWKFFFNLFRGRLTFFLFFQENYCVWQKYITFIPNYKLHRFFKSKLLLFYQSNDSHWWGEFHNRQPTLWLMFQLCIMLRCVFGMLITNFILY